MAQPIISLAIAGNRSTRELTLIAKEDIKKRLESTAGIGNVELVGGEEREILVELDLTSLEAYNLSIFEVQNKIAAASLELPAGKFERGDRDVAIRTLGKITSVDQLAEYGNQKRAGRTGAGAGYCHDQRHDQGSGVDIAA